MNHCGLRAVLPMLLTALALSGPTAKAQTLSERVLGKVILQGQPGPGIVVSTQGDQFARRERFEGGERYATLRGPGPVFDRILPGALWIDDRLVYLATRGKKEFLVDGPKLIPLSGSATSPLVLGRVWPSADRRHYLVFASDGKTVGWLADGKVQLRRFDRLVNVPVAAAGPTPLFVAAERCLMALVGHVASSKPRWDLLYWVKVTAGGAVVYAHGARAGLPSLHRNGVEILRGKLEAFQPGDDGAHWLGVVDRSADGVDRIELVGDAGVVDKAPADLSRQRLFVSADGLSYRWLIADADYVGATLRRPGRLEEHFVQAPQEVHVTADGRREALVMPSDMEPSRWDVRVDGLTVLAGAPGIASNQLHLAGTKAFAFKVIDGERRHVFSHLGAGPVFEELSAILMLPDGRPVYAGFRATDGHFIVVGDIALSVNVANLHHLDSLRLEGGRVRVLGTRGDEVVDISVSPD